LAGVTVFVSRWVGDHPTIARSDERGQEGGAVDGWKVEKSGAGSARRCSSFAIHASAVDVRTVATLAGLSLAGASSRMPRGGIVRAPRAETIIAITRGLTESDGAWR